MDEHEEREARPGRLAVKGLVSGVVMGLANLVPGVSAGAVMLATGTFRAFIQSMSEVTRLRFRPGAVALLGAMALGWVGAVVLGAGIVKQLVIDYRWAMYSLFIGLTLGGVPLVWQPREQRTASVWVGAAMGFAIMAALGVLQMTGAIGAGGGNASVAALALGGLLAAGATVLPGGSGTFVLILMGLYVPLLGAVENFKDALTGLDPGAIGQGLRVLGPFGVGMGAGVVTVSLAVKWAIDRFPRSTFGLLLGLLVGSVVALWPFQVGVRPEIGDVVQGRVVTAGNAGRIPEEDWPVAFFTPGVWQVLASIGIAAAACAGTVALARREGGVTEGGESRVSTEE